MNLIINNDYFNPSNNGIEIIERKGLGHPDSLADMLAKECSRVYSKYCMDNFGCILHHNFDKLYIGGGCFRYENGKAVMYDKIKIKVNGRVSNTMNHQKIDVEKLLTPVIKEYINHILPRVDVENEVLIDVNCTQNTKLNNWFSPESKDDIPDTKKLLANDTSLCVSHQPMTLCERIVHETEEFFWNFDDKYPKPKFNNIGQDIKVMLSRIKNDINITICMPVYNDKFTNLEEYSNIVLYYERLIQDYIIEKEKDNLGNNKITVSVNRNEDGSVRMYSLIKGSCIECGEEGVVGRGNNSNGLIPAFRQHTMESPFGKNERYHTGRVLSYLGNNISLRIYNECKISNSIYCLTRNNNSLMKPFLLYISVDKQISNTEKEKINDIINEELDEETYLVKILNDTSIY